jgi:hypothetical protein
MVATPHAREAGRLASMAKAEARTPALAPVIAEMRAILLGRMPLPRLSPHGAFRQHEGIEFGRPGRRTILDRLDRLLATGGVRTSAKVPLRAVALLSGRVTSQI